MPILGVQTLPQPLIDDGVDGKAVTCCVPANEIKFPEGIYCFVERQFILRKLGHPITSLAFGVMTRSSPLVVNFRALKVTLTLGEPGFTFLGQVKKLPPDIRIIEKAP